MPTAIFGRVFTGTAGDSYDGKGTPEAVVARASAFIAEITEISRLSEKP